MDDPRMGDHVYARRPDGVPGSASMNGDQPRPAKSARRGLVYRSVRLAPPPPLHPVPPPDVADLQQKLLETQQLLDRAVRASRESELRAKYAETLFESKREIIENQFNKWKKGKNEKESELVVQVKKERRDLNEAHKINKRLHVENDSLRAHVERVTKKAIELSQCNEKLEIQLHREVARREEIQAQSDEKDMQYETKIAELMMRLARHEVIVEQQYRHLQPRERKPEPENARQPEPENVQQPVEEERSHSPAPAPARKAKIAGRMWTKACERSDSGEQQPEPETAQQPVEEERHLPAPARKAKIAGRIWAKACERSDSDEQQPHFPIHADLLAKAAVTVKRKELKKETRQRKRIGDCTEPAGRLLKKALMKKTGNGSSEVHTRRYSPILASFCDPINIFQLCNPRAAEAMPLDSALTALSGKYSKFGQEKWFQYRDINSLELSCDACTETVHKRTVFEHFFSVPHIKKVRALGAAVSRPALQYWLREMQTALSIAAVVIVPSATATRAAAAAAIELQQGTAAATAAAPLPLFAPFVEDVKEEIKEEEEEQEEF